MAKKTNKKDSADDSTSACEVDSQQVYKIAALVLDDGSCPFETWRRKLRDLQAKQRIQQRLDRIERGNLGDTKDIGLGVKELKIDTGPGYRIYYGISNQTIVVILLGGDKSTQDSDAGTARTLWKEYKDEIEGHRRDIRG